jgi:hypothetical protein
MLWVAAAVVTGLVIGGGVTAAVNLAGDDGSSVAAGTLSTGSTQIRAVTAELGRAEDMDGVRAAGARASAAVIRLRREESSADAIEDAALRRETSEALGLEISLLEGLARLDDSSPPDPDAWAAIDSGVTQNILALRPLIRKIGAESVAFRHPALSALANGQAQVEAVIRRGARRLSKWRRAVVRVRRQRSGELAVISSYSTSIQSYLDQYGSLRSQLDDWIALVDSDGVSFDEAYDFLAEASSSRSSIRQGIAALDAPAALASTHNDFLSVVDQAIAAVDSAYDGVIEYEFDFDYEYGNYKETPGWQTFKRQSEEIAGRYESASASLEDLVAAEKHKVERRALPPKPTV